MQSDERPESVNPDDEVMGSDESQDENLSWLLDQDLSESSDSLFSVTHDESEDQGLTQAEAQMAARPLVAAADGGSAASIAAYYQNGSGRVQSRSLARLEGHL